MKPVTQPANKPTGPFHSVGPLAWDQVMPLNKELLSCITSPHRGHPGRSLLSPGTASLQRPRPPPHRPLYCFLLQPSPIIPPLYSLYPGEAFISASRSVNKRARAWRSWTKQKKNELNPSNGIFNWISPDPNTKENMFLHFFYPRSAGFCRIKASYVTKCSCSRQTNWRLQKSVFHFSSVGFGSETAVPLLGFTTEGETF